MGEESFKKAFFPLSHITNKHFCDYSKIKTLDETSSVFLFFSIKIFLSFPRKDILAFICHYFINIEFIYY